jgi:methylmalonyl-CoA mutase, N-terminal domain
MKREEWEQQVLRPALVRTPERESEFKTASGITLDRLYGPDEPNESYSERLGYPGSHPYTRGVQPTMYRGRLWTMRQYAGYGTAEESNARYRYLLAQGQSGLSVAFDLPTQMGYDSDHPLADGEVGKVGVAICSVEDMERLMAEIPFDKVTTSMTINATAGILLAFYVAAARLRGTDERQLGGTTQNDILKEYIARGTYIYPVRPSLRLTGDIITYCAEHLPKWNPISISGYHIREAGSTAVQELAFTLANAIAYVEEVTSRGIAIDDFAPRLAFFFNAHSDFFEEVAKFRAARRMWARITKDRFGAEKSQSMALRFHTQTAGSTLTAQQTENNVIRVTLQALSAILGGTQSLHTNAQDEALALPTERSARTALRTQQIIAYESGVPNVVDPLGGSYFVEALTDEVEQRAWAHIEDIDKMGGTLAALDAGYQAAQINESSYNWQQEIDEGQRIIVGVNKFTSSEAPDGDIMKVDPALQAQQIARLQALRASRDNNEAAAALEKLRNAAAANSNLMPHILTAAEARCTLGEISDALRSVFGVYEESSAV